MGVGDNRYAPAAFPSQEGDPVRILQDAGWAAGSFWTSAEYLAPAGIRSPGRPARSESLYAVRHPGLHTGCIQKLIQQPSLLSKYFPGLSLCSFVHVCMCIYVCVCVISISRVIVRILHLFHNFQRIF